MLTMQIYVKLYHDHDHPHTGVKPRIFQDKNKCAVHLMVGRTNYRYHLRNANTLSTSTFETTFTEQLTTH